jgi:hypothetical protein
LQSVGWAFEPGVAFSLVSNETTSANMRAIRQHIAQAMGVIA